MDATLAAVAPTFLVIALGWVLHRVRVPDVAFWPLAERFTYVILLPALVVQNVATIRLEGALVPMAGAMGVAVGATGLGLLAARGALPFPGPAFTCIVQGSIRPNLYIGLALAAALHGRPGVTLAAVALASVVPTVNVISVYALSRHAAERPLPPGRLLGELLRNPILQALALGAALNVSGIGLPVLLDRMLAIVGGAALPIGLLAVGASLQLGRLHEGGVALLLAAALKLLGVPALCAALLLALGVRGLPAEVAATFVAMPAAPSAYVLARLMGGDAPLMARMISAQTLLAGLTLPLVLLGAEALLR